ncbi:phosphotransferase enzyme family protein [Chryseobacterium sp. MMS23-Vi53]|uniref:phosphotransferase enzyme family protein n=1 Tax=Chryseobacterium sp. MMS23-Vi53 TaxID=3386644 RepID=UPI0039EB312B
MEIKNIIHQFINTENYTFYPIDNGLINSTYVLENYENGKKYILQKINSSVFKNPSNIILNHLRVNCLLRANNYEMEIIEPIPSSMQEFLVHDINEQSWRLQNFIDESTTFIKGPSLEIAYKAAKAFSHFLDCINTDELIDIKETLPNFINFEKRISDYKKALQNADSDLIERAKKDIHLTNDFLSLPEKWIELIKNQNLPKRIIHADPKISNILFDENNEPIAVIDLDTVMISTILYDFGDMIRSYCNITDEDDGITENNFDSEIFNAVKKGFLSHLEEKLTTTELENLEYAAQVVIYIQAVRFLTDYLNGNIYYSTKYREHNLDRTRNQLRLLEGLRECLGLRV